MPTESSGHRRLKNTVKRILENAGFGSVDTEIDIDVDGDNGIEFSIDVCALEKNTLLVFQCKDVEKMPALKKELNATEQYTQKILLKQFKILASDTKKISDTILSEITEIKCCYVFTDRLANIKIKDSLKKAGFVFWDSNTVKYYNRISQILKHLTKNEILREFDFRFTDKSVYKESAIKINQENAHMYLVGMHPGLLLRIAYVYRRTGGKPKAYQRIITKERIENISRFFQETNNLLLPNPVIIVFDDDEAIQKEIEYKSGKLAFPTRYCSAWIIDGQHRIYGFKDHPKYKNWTPNEDEDFKIPVVVFDKLPFIEQNKAFLNINYYQKKIAAVLFNDLSTVIKDLNYEMTWPSLLVSELNKIQPWENMIKISELDTKKPISISGFAKTKLLSTLLGYNKKTKTYSGSLYNVAPFDHTKPFSDEQNQAAFNKQISTLVRFFTGIREAVYNRDSDKDQWLNSKKYGLTKFTSVNALLLVLDRLLEQDLSLSMDLNEVLSATAKVDFKNETLLQYGRGYPAMPKIANKIIKQINSQHGMRLKYVYS